MPREHQQLIRLEAFGFAYYVEMVSPLYSYYAKRLYEPGVSRLLNRLLEGGNTFIDVGAHVGYHTFLAAGLVGNRGKVIAFEPDPASADLLRRGRDVNGFKNIVLEEVAAGSADQQAIFHLMESGLSSLLHPRVRVDEVLGSFHQETSCRTIDLDKYCFLNSLHPTCIKIDVEGAEKDVVMGLQKTICDYHPYLIVDLHGLTNDEIVFQLQQCGYEVYKVKDSGDLLPAFEANYCDDLEFTVFGTSGEKKKRLENR